MVFRDNAVDRLDRDMFDKFALVGVKGVQLVYLIVKLLVRSRIAQGKKRVEFFNRL